MQPTDFPNLITCETCGWVDYEDCVDYVEDYYVGIVGYQCPMCGSKRLKGLSEKMMEMLDQMNNTALKELAILLAEIEVIKTEVKGMEAHNSLTENFKY